MRRVDAVLFDLGNTLVSYYRAADFHPVLARSVAAILQVLDGHGGSFAVENAFERARALNTERPDFRVWPLNERLNAIFAPAGERLPQELLEEMSRRFLAPIFATARLLPDTLSVLGQVRALGIKTAIVSNTPWGSAAEPWREELRRWGLLDLVDEAVFCVEVGWRKPAPQIFQRTLERLGVPADRALFVGDDVRWDVAGARGVGIEPLLLCDSATAVSDCLTIHRLNELPGLLGRP